MWDHQHSSFEQLFCLSKAPWNSQEFTIDVSIHAKNIIGILTETAWDLSTGLRISVRLVQSLSHVLLLFATPWTAARQASLSITNSRSLLKLMSIELVMPSNYHILCCPLLLPPSIFPASGSFPVSQFFISGGQSIGVSASASVLPMNIQDWFPLG